MMDFFKISHIHSFEKDALNDGFRCFFVFPVTFLSLVCFIFVSAISNAWYFVDISESSRFTFWNVQLIYTSESIWGLTWNRPIER